MSFLKSIFKENIVSFLKSIFKENIVSFLKSIFKENIVSFSKSFSRNVYNRQKQPKIYTKCGLAKSDKFKSKSTNNKEKCQFQQINCYCAYLHYDGIQINAAVIE